MSTAIAARIDTAEQALSVARDLAQHFATGAAARDRDRKLPYKEIDQLSASGLLAITVPAQFGGADLAPSVVAEVVRILATADPNIAQIPHSHFVYLNLLRLAADPPQQRELFEDVLGGSRIANAQSERGGKTVADIATTIRPYSGGLRLDGSKFYCTGSLYAHTLAVLTRLDDPEGKTGLPDGEYVAFIPADAAGVRIVDDWNGIGQRTTGSGTITFEGVSIRGDQLVARAKAVGAPSGYGAFAQLLHVAIDAGIARGALSAAVEFARTKSRAWFEAGVDKAIDDPLLIQRFGELAVEVTTAEATLTAAGTAVDATFTTSARGAAQAAAAASIAVATAKIVADRAANDVASALFEVSGTRSAGADLGLDHFWRNARTHTLHDPVRWKYQHIGRALLHKSAPPTHGVI
ncbi:SfnB family sulfur acquisition oxidoreductase [Williamsia sp. 1138]|uniref:SfnB family sulfur acquisition oxidoreductase n=1 Tax=Gordonia rubripertincta TaxID=36822 RepID=A0ABT4MSJ8_GORRU|nr:MULTISPECIES: SfnB family sulfur acquisition oxidoreductase [Mycobacteriales]MCZ4549947.1 SfnB family sulfur acquisition oxidoreductase [Gordonia rubripertincta]OZG25844.1 SfnB family sulfur acquisition oxidoreductase [Williamsia sp. 1138]